ncbi:MAG: 4Fe-4S binding protein [Terracidiphilus sp.]
MATPVLERIESSPTKKKPIRRSVPDRSQRIRHIVQAAFVVLNLWIGAQFYLWVRFYERGGHGLAVPRPAGVEGWLPIAGLMNTKEFFLTGRISAIHPAAMFLFMAFVSISLLAKKAFCSWICPVGTISESLWKLGRKLFRRSLHLPLHPPRWLDIPLRGLKYVLMGFFLFVVGTMSADALQSFMATPYGLIADVKMLNFFRDMGETAALMIVLLVVGSMLVRNFWCRYLCPYGALMGLVSLLSPIKIRRDADACIDCGKCAGACPAALPVDRLVRISSVECTACMECVAACPSANALQLALPPRRGNAPAQRWLRRALSPLAVACLIVYLFLGAVLFAHATNHWQTRIPSQMYLDLIPNADSFAHGGI